MNQSQSFNNSINEHEISATRKWVEEKVIKLNLCPFAAREHNRGAASYIVSSATTEIDLLADLEERLLELSSQSAIRTEFIIHPRVLRNFDDYNQFLNLADMLVDQLKLSGIFQLASFHPHYCFYGASQNSAQNYTNRSPFPMLHILREADVEQALSKYPDASEIPERNIALLESIGFRQLQNDLEEILNEH